MVGKTLLISLFFILMIFVVYGIECASDCTWGTCSGCFFGGCEDTLSISWQGGYSSSATLYDGDCMNYDYTFDNYVSSCGECVGWFGDCKLEGCSCTCVTGSYTGARCSGECDDIDGPSDCYYDCTPSTSVYGTAICGAGYFWSSSKKVVPGFFTYCDGISKPRFVKLGTGVTAIKWTDKSFWLGGPYYYLCYVDSGSWNMNCIISGNVMNQNQWYYINPKEGYVYVAFLTDASAGELYIIGFNCCDSTIRSTFSSWCSSVSCCDATETDCFDGVDNDCDGYTDCEDADCCNEPGCIGVPGSPTNDEGYVLTRCRVDDQCGSVCDGAPNCVFSDVLGTDYYGYEITSSCGICKCEACLQCGSYSVCDCDELYLKCGVNPGLSCYGSYGDNVDCRLIELSGSDCDDTNKYNKSIDLRNYIDFNSCAVYSCEYDTQCSVSDFLKYVTWEIDDGEKQGNDYVISSRTLECFGDHKITVHVGVQDILYGYCGGTKINCGDYCSNGREKCYTAVLEIRWRTDGDGDGESSCVLDCSSAQTSSSEYDISDLYTAYNCNSVSCTLESQPGSSAYLDDCNRIYNMVDTGFYGIKVTGDSTASCTIWIEKTSEPSSCSATGQISCPAQSGNTLDSRADVYITDGTIYSGTCSATDGVNTYSGTFVKDSATQGHCEFANLPSVSGSLSLTINADVNIHDTTCDQDRTLSLLQTCQYTQQAGSLDIKYSYPTGECGDEITVTLECVDASTGTKVDNVKWTITDVSGVVVSSTCDSVDNPCTVTVITDKYSPSVSFKARCEVV